MSSKKKWLFLLIFFLILLLIIGTFLFVQFQYEQSVIYESAKKSIQELYQDSGKEIPRLEVSLIQVEQVEKKVEKVIYDQERKQMLVRLETLKKYISIRDLVFSCFDDEVLKSDITLEKIDNISLQYEKLPQSYQLLLKGKIDLMRPQYQTIQTAQVEVANLFTDPSMMIVKDNVNREQYNQALAALQLVIQTDVIHLLQERLNVVETELKKREEAEARRLAEIARKKREQEIANAWHILKVPYISQNKSNVFNGCEVASLLMGLQYKGYLQNMSLQTYAEQVPKNSDPFLGFTYSIFDLEPLTVPHWIAPAPLALFGRNSSGNPNIVDSTGASLLDLDQQIMSGNPVVIYLTSKFKDPKPYIEGAPKNIHVLLLTGYNHITGEQIITDPWTHDDGTTEWKLSKTKVEKIYNATGKRSVVIG